MKKNFSLFFALLMVIGILGCSNQSEKAKEKIKTQRIDFMDHPPVLNVLGHPPSRIENISKSGWVC